MGGSAGDRVVCRRLHDRVKLVEVVPGQPLLNGARLEPELKREIGERMPSDREGD
jgi:hypothetical protein